MRIKAIIPHIFLLLLCLVMFYPVFWWIGAAFKTTAEITSTNIFPSNPTWENIAKGWFAIKKHSFSFFYWNTLKLVVSVLLVTVVSTSIVAYGFARLNFPLKNFWFTIVLITLMLPHQATIVPQFILFNNLGWIDSYLPFIVPHALASGDGAAFFIFMLVQFIRGIPRELDEAAKIDGATTFKIFYLIILRLLTPAMVSMCIFCFLWTWDDFYGQMLFITSIDKFTVGLALKFFVDSEASTPWGQLFAMSLVSVVPGTLIFFFSQRYFVEGIATTGLKG